MLWHRKDKEWQGVEKEKVQHSQKVSLYSYLYNLGMVLPVNKHKHTNDIADNLAYVCDNVKLAQSFPPPLSLFHPLTISAWLASSSKQRQVALATSLLMKEKGSL